MPRPPLAVFKRHVSNVTRRANCYNCPASRAREAAGQPNASMMRNLSLSGVDLRCRPALQVRLLQDRLPQNRLHQFATVSGAAFAS
jgi:hypothetical protein